jgi:aminoglycoside phosphotransferase (APT) family kinase protein
MAPLGVVHMIDTRDGRGKLRSALEEHGEAPSAELYDLLWDLLGGSDPTGPMIGLRMLKSRVFRLEIETGEPYRSVVLKRLEPATAQRNRLLAERWLPALGLGDRCAGLLGAAADRDGEWIWHVYEDLGGETLAVGLDQERVRATVDLIAELHTRAAHHHVLPDVRKYGRNLGLQYFTANVEDALAALEALADSGIETPREYVGLADRLLDRLRVLLADAPRRAQVFEESAGPDTLLHGDLWTINVFVNTTAGGLRVRLVDWDRLGVGPFSYDLSTLLFRFPPAERPWIVECYRDAVARRGCHLASSAKLEVLFDTAERARYANRVIWPAQALVKERAAWGFPELVEVERWFRDLDSTSPTGPCLERTGLIDV